MQKCDQYDNIDQKIKNEKRVEKEDKNQTDVREVARCSHFCNAYNNDCILVLCVNVISN